MCGGGGGLVEGCPGGGGGEGMGVSRGGATVCVCVWGGDKWRGVRGVGG